MSNHKKAEQLGIPAGTAFARLKKAILFDLLVRFNLNVCFRCNELIETLKSLSIDHKIAWLDSEDPKKMFYDMSNIAFSHLSCNVAAANRPNKKRFTVEEKREFWSSQGRKYYTPEKRREKYEKHGF